MMVRNVVVSALLVAGLAGCATGGGMQVTSEHDPAASFTDLRTFAWMPGAQREIQQSSYGADDARFTTETLDPHIRAAVERELAVKGFQRVASGSPDFFVRYHAALSTGLNTSNMNSAYSDATGWSRPGGNITTSVDFYEAGSLVLDVVTASPKALMWRGFARARIDRTNSQEVRLARIDEAVQKIISRFPPRE